MTSRVEVPIRTWCFYFQVHWIPCVIFSCLCLQYFPHHHTRSYIGHFSCFDTFWVSWLHQITQANFSSFLPEQSHPAINAAAFLSTLRHLSLWETPSGSSTNQIRTALSGTEPGKLHQPKIAETLSSKNL